MAYRILQYGEGPNADYYVQKGWLCFWKHSRTQAILIGGGDVYYHPVPFSSLEGARKYIETEKIKTPKIKIRIIKNV
jgi:hypothetical protein